MTPPTCDITEGGLQVAHTCEVSTLFEEESSIFPLKGGSVDLSCPIDPPASQEEMAQSAHLMTLGLCRISACRPGGCWTCTCGPTGRGGGFGCVRCSLPADSWSQLELHWRTHCRRQQQKKKKKKKKKREASHLAHHETHADRSDGRRRQLIGRADRKKVKHLDRETKTQASDSRKRTKTKTAEEEEESTRFCCSLCHRKFSTKLTLRRHLGVHGGDKPFTCPTCPYRSRLKASLLQHLRTHTGEKPYRCSQCDYASIDRSSLIRHSRTHSQEKPYRCDHCDYSSIQKKSLDLHARRHHTGEAFPCQQCEYSSPDRQLLLRHVRRHHAPPL
ncbi:zinc finger protein 425 [Scomber scombrus]|uniref:zinc finger protein 425 n=1 Tax=Scomber scombrus TaxID=13677 RepID=UPI002DDBFE9D|nr:zinc finger protein 425 [Scomber scombrus]